MQNLAQKLITEAAIKAGLPATDIFQELVNASDEDVFLSERRMEISFLDEELTYQGWRFAKAMTTDVDNGKSKIRTRYSVYKTVLLARVVVRANEQLWLEKFCRDFLLALPSKQMDEAGNPVRIKAQKSTRKGYTFASIKIEEKPVQSLHISFSGHICRDEETGTITSVNIKQNWKH